MHFFGNIDEYFTIEMYFKLTKWTKLPKLTSYGGLTQTPLVTFETSFLEDGIGYYGNNGPGLLVGC